VIVKNSQPKRVFVIHREIMCHSINGQNDKKTGQKQRVLINFPVENQQNTRNYYRK
jgi:hypothetical protein